MSGCRRIQRDSSASSDAAFVGLCRALTGFSVLLLVGLVGLVWASQSGCVNWDASVVQVDRGINSREEAHESALKLDSSDPTSDVIRFDLDKLNSEGLFGPEDGLRALSYEFCIPAAETHVKEIQALDATAVIQQTSPGRIGCSESEYLVIGSTYQPDFKEALDQLASLPYVDRIDEAFFE